MKKIRKVTSLITAICLFCLLNNTLVYASNHTANNELQNLAAYNSVIQSFNNEYGTNFHFLSEDELSNNGLDTKRIRENILNMSLDEFRLSLLADFNELQKLENASIVTEMNDSLPVTRGTTTQYCYLRANGYKDYYGAFTLNANGGDAGVYQYTSVNRCGYQGGVSIYEFLLTSTSHYFTNNYKQCVVSYKGKFYNVNTGIGLTALRTYNVDYTYGGGNLIMNVTL